MADLLTEQKILSFVGSTRIVLAEPVIKAWNRIIKEGRTDRQFKFLRLPRGISISYSKETIEPILRQRMWHLIYDPGISLAGMREILGSKAKEQPCHYDDNVWWLSDESCNWSTEEEEPNYYLVNMKEDLCNMTWQDQSLAISNMDEMFIRASLRLMISLNISYYLVHRTYLFEEYSHWGPKMDSRQVNICASRITSKGFVLYKWNRNCPNPNLGVCIVRKFDCN